MTLNGTPTPSLTPEPARQGACCSGTSRRALLGGAIAAGGAVTLAACATDTATTQEVPSATGTPHTVGTTSDLPVGGELKAAINKTEVVVYRPDETTVLAYSAICTHAGCIVDTTSEQQFHCACHDSVFSAADGSVVSGPAPRALARYGAAIEDSNVVVYLSR